MYLSALDKITCHFFCRRAPEGAPFFFWLSWRARAKQRRDLLALDDQMLKDIGISRAQAQSEAAKLF